MGSGRWAIGAVQALVLAVVGAGPALADGGTSEGEGSTPTASYWYTYKDCPGGYFCVYDSYGHMCKWKDPARNWYTSCSWVGENYPKYAFNNAEKSGWGATIYRYTVYESPIGGCLKYGKKVTLAGNYNIGSHRWDCIPK